MLYHYQCHRYWLLGVIPVVVGSTCMLVRAEALGNVTRYAQYACNSGDGPVVDTPAVDPR